MSAASLDVFVDGIGWWSPGLPDWNEAQAALRMPVPPAATATTARPGAAVLAPNERRRAPDPVLLACEVAAQASVMAGRSGADLPCVFTSMHGDIGTTDSLCTTLAEDPLQLSPTKFHNSVHNAPAGYWTVATECHAASTSIAAWRGSFAAGLLEAAVEALAEATAVLLVGYDIAARGALAGIVDGHAPVAFALVLAAQRGERSRARLRLHGNAASADAAPPDAGAGLAASNPIAAGALPLFAALAAGTTGRIHLYNGRAGGLGVEIAA